MTPQPSRALRAAAATTVVITALAGCTWRAETPPLEIRTPTPVVVLRDAAAVREQAVIDARGAGVTADVEALTAPVRLDALGGVYVEYPGATPSPSPSPADGLETVVVAARDGALAGADAAAELGDGSLAALLRSIALSHAVALDAGGVADAGPGERTMPGAGDALVPDVGTALTTATIADLAVEHDRAAFAYEVAAARSGAADGAAWLERARQHRERAATLVAIAGVEDRRADLYDVPVEQVQTRAARRASALARELALADRYAALIDGAAAQDVAWILSAAYDGYLDAASLPTFAAGDVPALPGLDVER